MGGLLPNNQRPECTSPIYKYVDDFIISEAIFENTAIFKKTTTKRHRGNREMDKG